MKNIKILIPKEIRERFIKVLTYINDLEAEWCELNNRNDGKDYRQDLEWLEGKVGAVKAMFDIMACDSGYVLEYDTLHERWTIRVDLGNELLTSKEDS